MKVQPYPFKEKATLGVRNAPLRTAITNATFLQDGKRRSRGPDLPDLLALRTLAGRIKQHTIEHLDTYLAQFVEAATAAGATIHYAATTEEVHAEVAGIVTRSGLKNIIKAKSMVSEEVELNHMLEKIADVVETDLGEFIVQIDKDRPCHIVTPVIHKTAKDIGASLHRFLGAEYTEDPQTLTKLAREYLREKFRSGEIGISGANFAVAETGSLVVCTNEGNGRMCTSRPKIHIALMGIEKVIPRLKDLSVFLKLLARSATGQTLTVYTSMLTGPRRADELDGPEELHIVLIDRGRTRNLASPYRRSLGCIRCGACMNACPVYRNVGGGHAYGGIYPGPIGSLLTPLYDGFEKYKVLPHASSLCGACAEACPVRIPLPELLIQMRNEQVNSGITHWIERAIFWIWTVGLRFTWMYVIGQKCAAWFMRYILGKNGWVHWVPGPPGGWTRKRPLPVMAKKSFRSQWKKMK